MGRAKSRILRISNLRNIFTFHTLMRYMLLRLRWKIEWKMQNLDWFSPNSSSSLATICWVFSVDENFIIVEFRLFVQNTAGNLMRISWKIHVWNDSETQSNENNRKFNNCIKSTRKMFSIDSINFSHSSKTMKWRIEHKMQKRKLSRVSVSMFGESTGKRILKDSKSFLWHASEVKQLFEIWIVLIYY